MEDLFLLLILGLIFGTGCVMMAAADLVKNERLFRRLAFARKSAHGIRNALCRLFHITKRTVCYMVMCDPDPVDCEEVA